MPQRNTIRRYSSGYCYHIYNRGVEKRNIFNNSLDYKTFLSILESYMEPKTLFIAGSHKNQIASWRSKLEENEIEILCFCLMPNHFHLLLKQNSKDGVTRFMRRISNAYVSYFNKKHDRVGTLFQGKFKAVLIDKDAYLLHLSRYIHLNPLEVRPLTELHNYPHSSYACYLNKQKIPWINTIPILSFFKKTKLQKVLGLKKFNTYKSFVELEPRKDILNLDDYKLE